MSNLRLISNSPNVRSYSLKMDMNVVDPLPAFQEMIRTRFGHLHLMGYWSYGGIELATSLDLAVNYHILVKDYNRRNDYEFHGWPHFKLSI